MNWKHSKRVRGERGFFEGISVLRSMGCAGARGLINGPARGSHVHYTVGTMCYLPTNIFCFSP